MRAELQPDDDTAAPAGRPDRTPADADPHGALCPRCGGLRDYVIRVREGETVVAIHICHECDIVPGNAI